MPTKNRIRVLLAENHTNAKELTAQLPDVDEVAMSYVVRGFVLPTKDTLNAMTAALNCETKDLYDLNEIDLAGRGEFIKALRAERIPRGTDGHDGMERVYIWCEPGEKEALFKVVKQLDYPSVAEWFRDKMRADFEKAAKLDGKMLYEAAAFYSESPIPTIDELVQIIKDAPFVALRSKDEAICARIVAIHGDGYGCPICNYDFPDIGGAQEIYGVSEQYDYCPKCGQHLKYTKEANHETPND